MTNSFDSLEGLQIKDDHLEQVLRGKEFLKLDGAMGTLLHAQGYGKDGELPVILNITHPEVITAIHAGYIAAGAEVITLNTFGASARQLEGQATVEQVFCAAADCARAAGARYVGANIGPVGALLEPLGTLSFEQAYDLFVEQVQAANKAKCDLFLIETITDLREAKAALLAVKEHSNLPVFVTMTFGEDERTFLGTSPEVTAATLSSMGAHAVGFNCSLGPDDLIGVARRMAKHVRCPLIARPNAGLPRVEDGETVYDVSPEEFASSMRAMVECGASVLGGCCGAVVDFIANLHRVVDEYDEPCMRAFEPSCVITGVQDAVVLPDGVGSVQVIGERINPTGKSRLKAALRNGDLDYLVGEAVSQHEAGADLLDVNVGLPDIDEPIVLRAAVEKLQATVALPLVIDSADVSALEAAVRGYTGKPLINSVNGNQESLDAVLPLVKKYGCCVIGLTLDESGIPATAQGRFEIAQRIVYAAENLGIPRQDIVIDCLVMSVATNQDEIPEILKAVSLVKEKLGVRTVLGVSNVSFGLPQRRLLNATFLAAALGVGLDMPIIDPTVARYADAISAFKVVNGQDKGSEKYIEAQVKEADPYDVVAQGGQGVAGMPSAELPSHAEVDVIPVPAALEDCAQDVREMVHLILSGRKQPMGPLTERVLGSHDPLEVVNGVFIPALDQVSLRFERGEFFLPNLMASAEAVKSGFDVVKAYVGETSQAQADERKIIIATVKGDIHDIGKNIVKMLLENYGFNVIDLGRDVASEMVVAAVREHGVRLVGLSALMTTTVKAMEETIALLRAETPEVKVFVGGAVLTSDYAMKIGADYYGKDAAESARLAERFFAGECG